ncbi:MAG: bestrophin family ion channel, partial [Bacteroidota bacterium]
MSIIGTAVAFYVGFKNNSAYDRMWEARKIWGGIVNSSRAWGSYVDGYLSNQFTKEEFSEGEIKHSKKRLIYRHIAWLYALRSQLLKVTSWEHASQRGPIGKTARYYQQSFGIGLVDDEVTKIELRNFLPADEHDRLINNVNTATQIINEQFRDLKELRQQGLIDDFRHMAMGQVLYDFYELQGKCERIKKFPLPRQYANMSRYFVGIFIFLLPFSMIPALLGSGTLNFTVTILVTALLGWVYVMMEIVGDYTENPFQGMANDIPMLS